MSEEILKVWASPGIILMFFMWGMATIVSVKIDEVAPFRMVFILTALLVLLKVIHI